MKSRIFAVLMFLFVFLLALCVPPASAGVIVYSAKHAVAPAARLSYHAAKKSAKAAKKASKFVKKVVI